MFGARTPAGPPPIIFSHPRRFDSARLLKLRLVTVQFRPEWLQDFSCRMDHRRPAGADPQVAAAAPLGRLGHADSRCSLTPQNRRDGFVAPGSSRPPPAIYERCPLQPPG